MLSTRKSPAFFSGDRDMPIALRQSLSIALGVLALAAFSLPAAAQTADQAKAAGQVGEQADGYLGIPPGAPSGGQAIATRINAQRKKSYEAIAKKRDITTAQVGKLSGKRQLSQSPSGQYVRNASGRWQKKP